MMDCLAGENFEIASGEVFLSQLDVVDAAASSFGNGCEQSRAASGFVTSELRTIGDVVKKQIV